MRVFHLVPESTFFSSFSKLIGNYFLPKEHFFWTFGKVINSNFPKGSKGFKYTGGILELLKGLIVFIYYSNKADKIVVHGLFRSEFTLLLLLMPWLHKRCHWVIWGGDLYSYNHEARFIRVLKTLLISRIGYLLTYLPDDLEKARKWYKAKGKHYECLMYESNVFIENSMNVKPCSTSKKILVGNSSDPSNNHSDIFEFLEGFENIRLYIPLTYGCRKNALYIRELATRKFQQSAIPIMDNMPYEEYLALLADIEFAIFYHPRQQAMGNTINLLGLGKKVFLRKGTSQWQLFETLGIKVYDAEGIELNLSQDDLKLLSDNRVKVSEYFSKEKLIEQYRAIFDEKR